MGCFGFPALVCGSIIWMGSRGDLPCTDVMDESLTRAMSLYVLCLSLIKHGVPILKILRAIHLGDSL